MLESFHNLAPWDRALRILVGLVALVLGAGGWLPGLWSVAAVVFCWVPLLTGAIGWCPFYAVGGVRTLRR